MIHVSSLLSVEHTTVAGGDEEECSMKTVEIDCCCNRFLEVCLQNINSLNDIFWETLSSIIPHLCFQLQKQLSQPKPVDENSFVHGEKVR
jgi:hypothetical protein